jgi:hypothetical protein
VNVAVESVAMAANVLVDRETTLLAVVLKPVDSELSDVVVLASAVDSVEKLLASVLMPVESELTDSFVLVDNDRMLPSVVASAVDRVDMPVEMEPTVVLTLDRPVERKVRDSDVAVDRDSTDWPTP